MATGQIKRLERDRGFGFIRPAGEAEDVFFHSTGLQGRIVDVRAADARRGAAHIKVLTLELRAKWDELRAARVAAYGPDQRTLVPEGYHASDGRRYRPRLTRIERDVLPRNGRN